MKLRHRLALYFAVGSSALLVASRLVTLESFSKVQEFDLDRGLVTRAAKEGNDVALVGRKALEAEYLEKEGDPDPLEQLVTYGAIYRADGSLDADTQSFAHAPSLAQIGIDVTRGAPPRGCFDFAFRGSTLRGVLVEVKGSSAGKQFLLLAASRRDMDADARQLLAVGWWVLAASIPIALAVGWWFGRRTSRGIEDLAAGARRVAGGELSVAFAPRGAHDEEVVALGSAMGEMVTRLKMLLETERRFASHAAHELRSPLAVLRGELELALRRPRKGSEYEAFLRDALEDTKRLTHLAEDLLVVARAGSGAITSPAEEVDVIDVIDEATAASLARSPDAPSVQTTGDGARVRGVRADLVRMFRNLIDNAIEHGDASCAVRVDVTVDERQRLARVVVENDGPGVGAEDRDRIFEHFHRGADARAISGAGLGLGIAREIAVRHDGNLMLERAADPTRFVITLPLVRDTPSRDPRS